MVAFENYIFFVGGERFAPLPATNVADVHLYNVDTPTASPVAMTEKLWQREFALIAPCFETSCRFAQPSTRSRVP